MVNPVAWVCGVVNACPGWGSWISCPVQPEAGLWRLRFRPVSIRLLPVSCTGGLDEFEVYGIFIYKFFESNF